MLPRSKTLRTFVVYSKIYDVQLGNNRSRENSE